MLGKSFYNIKGREAANSPLASDDRSQHRLSNQILDESVDVKLVRNEHGVLVPTGSLDPRDDEH